MVLLINRHSTRPPKDESFTLESTKYHGKEKVTNNHFDTGYLRGCPLDIWSHTYAYDTAIQDTSWIYRVSEKLVCCLSRSQFGLSFGQTPQLSVHSRKKLHSRTRYGRTKDTTLYVQIWQGPIHKMNEKPKITRIHFLGFCS